MAQPAASAAVNESWKKSVELSTQSSDGLLSLMAKGQEIMSVVLAKDSDRKMPRMDDTDQFDTNSLNEQPSEDAEETGQLELFNNDGQDGRDMMMDDHIEEEREKDETVDNTVLLSKDISETVEMEKKISSRTVPMPLKYADFSEDSDEEVGPPEKKSKSDSAKSVEKTIFHAVTQKKQQSCKVEAQSGSTKKKSTNDTYLECPECEYLTRSVSGWLDHLRNMHRTKPALAGLALLCQCGNESLSDGHKRVCSIAKFTVIRKRDWPIRRIEDEKTTPQCVLCDMFPKTPRGYVSHLNTHHKSTLKSTGIYLKCSCGLKVRTTHDRKHIKECNGRQFALHKLDEN